MKLITEDKVEVNESTKLFEGVASLLEATEYANTSRSYFFTVFKKERNKKTKKYETVFYGYGVPK